MVALLAADGIPLTYAAVPVSYTHLDVYKRQVLESMVANGYNLGGEQSGHVIMADYATTGDGLLTGLMLASRVAQTGMPLQELATTMTRMPQVMINVKNVDKAAAKTSEPVLEAVARTEERLGAEGRVLLRPSGTEPVVRVMVEAATHDDAQREAEQLVAVVEEHLSLQG